jgi:molybdopterin-guanine dinucleotide biosynthesis protein A
VTYFNNVTGVILAGGKSRRMGTDKALLDVGSSSMIKRVAQEMARLFKSILVAGSKDDYLDLGMPVISDIYPGCGPLGGIHAGLTAANTPYIFVVGCDMPFISAELMACLLSHVRGHDVIIPRDSKTGYHEPLFAVYGKNCIIPVENMLKENRIKVTGFHTQVRVKYIERKEMEHCAGSDKCFINVNTPDELAAARRAVEDGEI